MNTPNKRSSDPAPDGDWNDHYGGAGGMPSWLKVELRKAVTQLLAPGETPLDVDSEAADIVHNQLGIKGSKSDIGSGTGFKYQNELRARGDTAPHFAVEPNPDGAEIPYYELPDFQTTVAELKRSGDREALERFYRSTGRIMMSGVLGPLTLIRSDANNLPFPDESIGAVTWILSGYCIKPKLQLAAFQETSRVLIPDGLHLSFFSHEGSKAGIRDQEKAINDDLSLRLGVPCLAPTPISSWLTTFNALKLAKEVFGWAALREHKATMVFDTYEKMEALYLAHTTTRDLHKIPTEIVDGVQQFRIPTEQEFHTSFMATVGKQAQEAGIQADGTGGNIKDVLLQGFILTGKKRPKELPNGFKEV